MSKDKSAVARQGALEYNAYLIKNLELAQLTPMQRETAMKALYLNLHKLAESCDMF